MTSIIEDSANLKITKRITPFTSINAVEQWNIEKLIKILYSDDIIKNTIDWNERKVFEKVLQLHFKKKSDIKPLTKPFLCYVYHNRFQLLKDSIKIKYIYKKKRPFGRVYPVDSVGLCQARRQIRHTLCDGIYVDMDLVNCHFVVLNQIFKNKYTILNDYVNNREKYFGLLCDHYQKLGKDIDYKTIEGREICKGYFIKVLLYSGHHPSWEKINKLGTVEEDGGHELFTPFPVPDFFKEFREELSEISSILIKENPTFARETEEEKKEKNERENPNGSIISWFCQEWERRILEIIYDVLKKDKLIKKDNVVFCFDGLMILLTDLFDTEEKQQVILSKCEVEVYKKLNLTVKLKVKEFDEQINEELLDFEIPEIEEIVEEEIELEGNPKEMTEFYKKLFKIGGINTRLGIAELVNELFPKHYIYHDEDWYGWNELKNKWEKSVIPLNLCIMYDVRDYLLAKLKRFKINSDEYKGSVNDNFILLEKGIEDVIEKNLCNPLEVDFIVKAAKNIMVDNDLEFDMNKNLFGCQNGVYDIENDEFRPYCFDDFVTMSCGFDFEELREGKMDRDQTEEEKEKYNEIHRILEQVFPDKEVRKLVMLIFGSGISGKCIEKFFVFNGEGGNGKGLLDEFMKFCLGDYFCEADITLLTQKKKGGGGPNQELADIDKMRFLLYKEPGQYDGIENSNMKDQTGGGNIKGRGLYSSKTTVELHNTTVMECNRKPKLKEQPTKGDIRRIVDIHFSSTFTSIEEDVDEENHVYMADPLLKEDKWKMEHRNYFLNMLFGMLQELKKADYNIDKFIPQCVKDRSNEYLLGCYDIHQMFIDSYMRGNDKAFVSLVDIAKNIKTSESYFSLSKEKRREMKNNFIYDFFITNPAYRKHYREAYYYTVDGVQKCTRNILLGWVRKNEIVEEKEEEEVEDVEE